MKQRSELIATAVLLATTALIISGCEGRGTDDSHEAHSLIGPFRSYQAPSEVADLLRKNNLTWIVLEEDALSGDDPRPRFSVVRWRVDSFREGTLSGEASFVFFNGRLAEVILFPVDPSTLPSEQEASEATPSGVRVRVDRDYRGKRYISYEDTSLQKEKEAWLSKHS